MTASALEAGDPGWNRAEQLRARAGAFSLDARGVVAALVAGPATLAELVERSGMPRRSIEALLNELGPDLDRAGDRIVLHPDRRAAYRTAFALDSGLGLGYGPDPTATEAARTEQLAELIAGRPTADRDLDHVGATAETAARRATWLAQHYDLDQARLLFVGDHDLTSLAVAALGSAAELTVADLDDRILAYIDQQAVRRGWPIRCLWGDFRLGLPSGAQGSADLAFTDPPYTPDGVSTFLVASAQGLAEPDRGRVVMAYGYGNHQPGLGVKVQQAVLDLGFAFEAILPGFNRYQGAQAIGARSDLYVCRPTARTWRALPGLTDHRRLARIYTHGQQSLESERTSADAALAAAAAELDRLGEASAPSVLVVGEAWPELPSHAQHVTPATLLGQGVPRQTRSCGTALIDLADAPAAWLLRVLLVLDADRAVIVTTAAASGEIAWLGSLLADRWSLQARPVGEHQVVTARRQEPAQRETAAAAVARQAALRVLSRSHGKLANVWREALIASVPGAALTKNQARALIAEAFPRPAVLDLPLVQLPAHQVAAVIEQVHSTAVRAAAMASESSAG